MQFSKTLSSKVDDVTYDWLVGDKICAKVWKQLLAVIFFIEIWEFWMSIIGKRTLRVEQLVNVQESIDKTAFNTTKESTLANENWELEFETQAVNVDPSGDSGNEMHVTKVVRIFWINKWLKSIVDGW
mgnify:CR=1 FL=1